MPLEIPRRYLPTPELGPAISPDAAKVAGHVAIDPSLAPEVIAYEAGADAIRAAVDSGLIPPRRHMLEADNPDTAAAQEPDVSLDFATWQPDADPLQRTQSYADEFVRRLLSGEVTEYTKNGEPRWVTGRKLNDDGTVKFLRIGYKPFPDRPVYSQNTATRMLLERIKEEPGIFAVPKREPEVK